MVIQDTAVVTLITGLTVILGKGAEFLYNYVKSKTAKSIDDRVNEINRIVEEINEIISKKDAEGMPLVYNPRKAVFHQEESTQLLRNLSHDSVTLFKTVEKLTTTLESMVIVLIKLEERSHKGVK